MKKQYISPEVKTLMTAERKPFLAKENLVGCSPQSLMDFSAGKERIDDSSFMPSSEGAATTGGFGSDNGPWESIW